MDTRWWSNLLEVLMRLRTTSGSNLIRWSITDLEIFIEKKKKQNYGSKFLELCGSHNHNPNRWTSMEGHRKLRTVGYTQVKCSPFTCFFFFFFLILGHTVWSKPLGVLTTPRKEMSSNFTRWSFTNLEIFV